MRQEQTTVQSEILMIDTSPRGEKSASRQVAKYLLAVLTNPNSNIIYRDLAREAPPHIDSNFLDSFLTRLEERTSEHQRALAYSDMLTNEFLSASTVIISTPMWNFGIPSTLKSWIDHIVRMGLTVTYRDNGFEGLAVNKKIYVIVGSGHVYSHDPLAMMDALTPSIRAAFAFIGAYDVEFIQVEGTNIPDLRNRAIEKAIAKIDLQYK
ncbi:FMN-dependent NADH-azoreductase [Elizabethkingia anophelis]|uniref:FMN-dependent NADH-azoreductase n=1 Tax=Elizabethkingia anophelis TaxID=1117645 RepID=UPI003786FFAB